MLDFALEIARDPTTVPHNGNLIAQLPSLRSIATDEQYYFQTNTIRAWAWHTSVKPYVEGVSSVQVEPDLRIYQGYALTDSGQPIRNVNELKSVDAARYRGDFLLFELDCNGFGRLIRSPVSNQQIYYAQNDRRSVVASRAAIAAALFWKTTAPPINPDFIRWICSYGVCSNSESLFRSVQFLRLDQSIQITPQGITLNTLGLGFLMSHELKALYQSDRKAYWDVAFERVLASTNCVDLVNDPIEFPLSGGKDSRLLLGLLVAGGRKDRISRVYTNGPQVSPEVRAANEICRTLGLRHEYVDGTSVVRSQSTILSDKLLTHLMISEAEVSPMDLSWQRRIHGKLSLHGQEGGLRNIAGNRTFSGRQQLLTWFRRHLGEGDLCEIYKPGVAERNLADIERFIDDAAAAGVDWSDIPSLHRVSYRAARWVSRTWKAYNELGFAPYIFVNADVIMMTLNAGHRSRILEEFHFEMFRRINPKLISIPFAGQQWEQETIDRSGLSICNSIPYQWPDHIAPVARRPTHEAFYRNVNSIMSFISDKAGSTVLQVIDPDKLRRFDKSTLKSGHYQPLWQTLQCVLAESTSDWTRLSDRSFAGKLEMPEVDLPASAREVVVPA